MMKAINEISVVTAFFNINRDDWSGFGRSAERYFSYFTSWARLRNRIIVYVETEELKAKIMAFRTGLGLAEQTFVNIVPRCADIDPELFETLRQATENPVQQIFRLSQRCPEVWNAQYNYIMLLKTWCVQDAVSRGQAEGQVAWVDFGYAHIEPA
ncbi:MAG: HtrL family protein, partial [Bacteroidales bacterium]|nr:HtrL family protein [Bacteroidales bacterium]